MRKGVTIFLAVLLAASAVYGIFWLFELRFRAGDVYPPYSSLRTDPLGTKVLYDALADTSEYSVSRNFRPLEKMANPAGSVIFYAGAQTADWPMTQVEGLESLANHGARVVVAFLPEDETDAETSHVSKKSKTVKEAKGDKAKKPAGGKKEAAPEEDEPAYIDPTKLGKRWGFTFAKRAAPSGESTAKPLVAHDRRQQTEPTLSWHTSLYFDHPMPVWHEIYACEQAPAIMERRFGRGSMVLAADSYFLSNEAMRAERAPLLLAWTIGANSRVVFDESHLGVTENPGIATLIRRYNLDGLVAAILVLAGLFVWQTGSSFMPPPVTREDEQIIVGKDSAAGFISLLRRGIPPARLIEVCMEQWRKSFAHGSGKFPGMVGTVETVAAGGSGNPVETYRAISQTLARKK